MNRVEIQFCCRTVWQPDKKAIQHWVDAALSGLGRDTEIVVRVVGERESAQLNRQYRNKQGATNILSFAAEIPECVESNLLGDLVVCAPVVEREALEQKIPLTDHWAHIIVHGVLHLLGYDHIKDEEAEMMENKEISILQQLNIDNPYLEAIQP